MQLADSRLLLDHVVFPESPRWRDGKLWFSDMFAGRVYCADEDGRHTILGQVEGELLSGLGWTLQGELLVVAMGARQLLKLGADGRFETYADLRGVTRMLANDMAVDPLGRAYIGEVGYDSSKESPRLANIVLVAPDSSPRVVADQLALPNGLAITPDGKTLIVAEMDANRLTAFDILRDGSLDNRRLWAATAGMAPDGICLDEDGAVWVGFPFAHKLMRIKQGGEVTHDFTVEDCPIACVIGGENRTDLFVCRSILPPEAMKTMSGGRISVLKAPARGAGFP